VIRGDQVEWKPAGMERALLAAAALAGLALLARR
jgi:hypothetical protein